MSNDSKTAEKSKLQLAETRLLEALAGARLTPLQAVIVEDYAARYRFVGQLRSTEWALLHSIAKDATWRELRQ